MGLIRRSFSFLDGTLFRKLFITFVRPNIEYAQVVWAPHLVKHINMLENVQKRATRLVDGMDNMDYSTRLAVLNLPTLAQRRRRGDMIELWKHFHSHNRATLSSSFKPRDRVSRKHNYQLAHNRSNDGVRGIHRNSFYHRVTDVWNNLLENVVKTKTDNGFECDVDKHRRDEDITL